MNDPNPTPAASPYNPYVAPQSHAYDGPAPQAGEAKSRIASGGIVKWLFLAATAGMAVNVVLGALLVAVAHVPEESVEAIEAGFQGLIAIAHMVLALVWIYVVWSALPRQYRRGTSPGGAIGALFIPIYNLAWMFRLNIDLCVALDAMASDRRKVPQAPRTLAVVAPIVHLFASIAGLAYTEAKEPLVGLAATFTANVLWTTYMFRVDRARRMLANA